MNIDYILHCRSAPYQSSRGWRKLDENWIWVHILKHFEKKRERIAAILTQLTMRVLWFHNDIIDQYEIWPFQSAAVVNLLLLSGACLCIQRCSSMCLNAPLWGAEMLGEEGDPSRQHSGRDWCVPIAKHMVWHLRSIPCSHTKGGPF